MAAMIAEKKKNISAATDPGATVRLIMAGCSRCFRQRRVLIEGLHFTRSRLVPVLRGNP